MYIYSKTQIGYSHIKDNKVCQDYSSSYSDKMCSIITCCDGHGGEAYIRSDRGSRLASRALFNSFLPLTKKNFKCLTNNDAINKIKLNILCEWNKLVDDDLKNNHITKKELEPLSDKSKSKLSINNIRAYGTTFAGAMLSNNKVLVAAIGDTEVFSIYKGKIASVFDEEDEPVANLTYSLCQDDAYDYIKIKLLDFKKVDGIILCTDGLTSPYQSLENFNEALVKPMIRNIFKRGNMRFLDDLVDSIALQKGVGDDVSLAVLLKDKIIKKYYERD